MQFDAYHCRAFIFFAYIAGDSWTTSTHSLPQPLSHHSLITGHLGRIVLAGGVIGTSSGLNHEVHDETSLIDRVHVRINLSLFQVYELDATTGFNSITSAIGGSLGSQITNGVTVAKFDALGSRKPGAVHVADVEHFIGLCDAT